MVYLLYGIFFISCLVLVAAVLLQPGKTDAGALFTSNVSSSAFSPRGTATVLSKITIVSATCFMLSALLLAMPALTGNVSVLSSNPDAPADVTVPADANSNTSSNTADSNANLAAPEAANTNIAAPAANIAPAANVSAANSVKGNANVANKTVTKPVVKTTPAKAPANK